MEPYWLDTEDWHTAGEPFRIVPRLPVLCQPQGATVEERWSSVVNSSNHPLDMLRRTLCHEPRGHADMYGGFLFPGDDTGAHLGVLFFHKDGFSTACGHGTIALGMYAVSHRLVRAPENGQADVVIDVPSGRVIARVHCEKGKPTGADFINVASYPLLLDVAVQLGQRDIVLDVAWGGAAYAYVDATQFRLAISPEHHLDFIKLGREIKAALGEKGLHKGHELYGVCFYVDEGETGDTIISKNVVIFADGQIDRSPCGSGTAARVAILHARGEMDGKRLVHRSIVNTEFFAGIDTSADLRAQALKADPGLAEGDDGFCIPSIYGSANLTGRHQFYIDPSDPVYPGFVFR